MRDRILCGYETVNVRTRPLKPSDIPLLKQWAEESGFEYPEPDSPQIEKILVVVDDEDRPILAVAAKRLVEVFGWFSPGSGAALRTEAVAAIHGPMIQELKAMGYECAEVFIPQKLERRGFGRFLTSRFGWYRNLISYGRKL